MLISQEEYDSLKGKDLVLLQCKQCHQPFRKTKKVCRDYINPKRNDSGEYCSRKCQHKGLVKQKAVFCKNCNKLFLKKAHEIKRFPNNFCSSSCNATYNNKHKTHGIRRSKNEAWLEDQLITLYPNLNILFNQKNKIDSELDIYIPDLSLAFEINGPHHYKPLYGQKKLDQVQTNDEDKFLKCLYENIDLYSIDSSSQKRFTPASSKKFLNIINQIINIYLLKYGGCGGIAAASQA